MSWATYFGGITAGAGALIELVGFKAAGIAKHSLAAYYQWILIVPPDSIFLYLQPMGLLGEPTTMLWVGGTIVVVGATYYGVKYYMNRKSTSASNS